MIDVSCALIISQDGRILVTQRSRIMHLPLKWEFPGGKVEPGESAEACLHREILEELGVEIEIIKRMAASIYDQGTRLIRLIPFQCILAQGEIQLTEHAAFLWMLPEGLKNLDWAAADIPVVQDYLDSIQL